MSAHSLCAPPPTTFPACRGAACGNMGSPAHRCRDIERQAGYLCPEQCAPPPPRASSDAMWFIRDGCGIACAIITWLLVFYAEFVVLFIMLLPSRSLAYSLLNGALFSSLAFLSLASHFRAMCTDPVSLSRRPRARGGLGSLSPGVYQSASLWGVYLSIWRKPMQSPSRGVVSVSKVT